MNRWYFVLVLLAFPALVLAQYGYKSPGYGSQAYHGAVPPPSTVHGYGGYPAYGGASTAAGSAMSGMGNAVSSKGSYNLSTSQAALNMTQVQKNEMQNHQTYENTYFQMQTENRAYQKALEGPQPTMEQMSRWAREEAPKPITPDQLNPVTGEINWPDWLAGEDYFASQRETMQALMTKKATQGGRLNITDQLQGRATIEAMFGVMKSHIRDVPTGDFEDSRNFLRSLIYATCKTDLQE